MTQDERHTLIRQIAALPLPEQVDIVEGVMRMLRQSFIDPVEEGRLLDEMLADPGFQRVLNNEDLPYPGIPMEGPTAPPRLAGLAPLPRPDGTSYT